MRGAPDPDALSLINAVQIFTPLSADDRRAVAFVTEIHRLDAGTKIFDEAAACDGLWMVASGAVRLFITGSSGQVKLLDVRGPASTLQLMAALDGRSYGATAHALEPVTACFLSRPRLLMLLARNPAVHSEAITGLCEEIRRHQLDRAVAGLKDARQRIACTLLRWSIDHGVPGDGGVTIPFRITRQDIAAAVGVTLETVIRNLAPLEREGIIRTSGSIITLRDLDALGRAAHCIDCTLGCERVARARAAPQRSLERS